MHTVTCPACALSAMLLFIDRGIDVNRQLAYDKHDMAPTLIAKIEAAMVGRKPSDRCTIVFHEDEAELLRQFRGVSANLAAMYHDMQGDLDLDAEESKRTLRNTSKPVRDRYIALLTLARSTSIQDFRHIVLQTRAAQAEHLHNGAEDGVVFELAAKTVIERFASKYM